MDILGLFLKFWLAELASAFVGHCFPSIAQRLTKNTEVGRSAEAEAGSGMLRGLTMDEKSRATVMSDKSQPKSGQKQRYILFPAIAPQQNDKTALN